MSEGVGSHQQDKIRRVSRRSWEYKLGWAWTVGVETTCSAL